jgi:hypothetical protein
MKKNHQFEHNHVLECKNATEFGKSTTFVPIEK